VGCVNARSAHFAAKNSGVSLCLSKHITQMDMPAACCPPSDLWVKPPPAF